MSIIMQFFGEILDRLKTYFWKVRRYGNGKRQIRRFQRPHSGLTTPRQETPSNIYNWFILPETSHWPIFLLLIVLIYVYYLSRNYLYKLKPLSLKLLVRKPSFSWNSHSRSFYRSFILQSLTGQQEVAYRHIIMLALHLKFPKK